MTSFIIKKEIETMRILGSAILNKVNVFYFAKKKVQIEVGRKFDVSQ